MTRASFTGAVEEIITEKLVEAINAAIQSPGASPGCTDTTPLITCH